MSEPKSKRKAKSKLAFPLGLIIIIFALVGIFFSVCKGIEAINKLRDNSDEKAAYQKMLVPVVMYDPETFDDISAADLDQLTCCAVWAIIKDSDNYDGKYKTDDQGRVIIPVEDVNVKFSELFGNDIKPTHIGVTSVYGEFSYNEQSKSYLVNSVGSVPIYTPKVIKIEKSSNTVTLTVAYLAAEGWAQDQSGNFIEPEPTKYVTVILRESNGNHYISAITNSELNEIIATVAPPAMTAARQPEEEISEPLIEVDETESSIPETEEESSTVQE